METTLDGDSNSAEPSVRFYNNQRDSVGTNDMSLNCDTVSNPLTRSNVGSLQPQSRLASIASISPTLTLTSSLAGNKDHGGFCSYGTEQPSTIDEMTPPSYITYTYAVSADGAISLNGVDVGDFLSGAADSGAVYYESSNFYSAGTTNSFYAAVALDRNRGFSVQRSDGKGSSQYCGVDR
jgi:hypothetical protein